MYMIFYNDLYIYDPYENQECITDAKLTSNVNAAAYLDFTISPKHPLYNIIEERSGVVKVYYDDEKLFEGIVESIEIDMYGYKSISCVSALDYLGDTCTRSYHTGSVKPTDKSEGVKAPESIDQFFQWLIDQHNTHVQNSNKTFIVGVNQGSSFSESNIIDVKSTSHESTAEAITKNLIDRYGGYLTLTYEGEQRVLNLYSDIHEMNAQIIDFGVNITDFTKTTTTEDQYTAIYPIGGTPKNKNPNDNNTYPPIDISSLPNGTTEQDADIVKSGDVIFSKSAVARYGYKEYYYSNNDILDATKLLKEAIIVLRQLMTPKVSIDVNAIDCALFMKGYRHLAVGEAVRVRSNPHKVDEYLMVSSIDLDLQNPENTEYTLGASYDTLTGQQSSYLRSLNSTINSTVDSVSALDKVSKETAIAAQEAKDTANTAKDTADTAKNTADTAKNAADTAQKTADTAQSAADTAQKTAEAADATANGAKNTADKAQTTATEAKTTADVAKENADAAKVTADKAQSNVNSLTSRVTNAETKIDQNTEAIELRATKTEVATIKNTADTANSTADSVKADLANNYSTTTQMNSAITASADNITSTVSKTYQVKGDYATNSKVDSSIESVQTQMTQTDNEIRVDFNKAITSTSSNLQSQINEDNEATNKKFSEINKYIRFVDGKIILGETGNELVLTIQNDRVSFMQAGIEVAYFSNNNLYVKRAEILSIMRIGNYEFIPRNDGGIVLRKWSL